MNFLGMGPLELVVILIIAVIVVGPERLPELARSIGQNIRKFREATKDISQAYAAMQSELLQEANDLQEEVKGFGQELQQEANVLQREVKDFQQEVQKEASQVEREVREVQRIPAQTANEIRQEMEQAAAARKDKPKRKRPQEDPLASEVVDRAD